MNENLLSSSEGIEEPNFPVVDTSVSGLCAKKSSEVHSLTSVNVRTLSLNLEAMVSYVIEQVDTQRMTFEEVLSALEIDETNLDVYRMLIADLEKRAMDLIGIFSSTQINLRSDVLGEHREELHYSRFHSTILGSVRNRKRVNESNEDILAEFEFVIFSRLKRLLYLDELAMEKGSPYLLYGLGQQFVENVSIVRHSILDTNFFFGACDDIGGRWSTFHVVKLANGIISPHMFPILPLTFNEQNWKTDADEERWKKLAMSHKNCKLTGMEDYYLYHPKTHAHIALLANIILSNSAQDLDKISKKTC